jgi:hypothetical protein
MRVGFEHRHGAAGDDHRRIESADLRRQELPRMARRIEHVAHHGGEELGAHQREQLLVAGVGGHADPFCGK